MSTNRQIKSTMEQMLRAEGYVVKVSITAEGFSGTVNAMRDSATMVLKYPATMTPGDVVFSIRAILDTLNGK